MYSRMKVYSYYLAAVYGASRFLAVSSARHGSSKMVAIEGNIGSGKSSCLNFFRKDRRIDIHSEPVDAWRNVADTNALKLLYEDPPRWSFLFNQLAMLGRLKLQVQMTGILTHPIKMVERSIYSSHYVFVLNNYREKHMTDLEFKVADDWFKLFSTKSAFSQINHFIYLRTSPELCFKRTSQRNRPEENKLSLEFLTKLHNLHEDLFIGGKVHLPGSVHVVDASKDLKEMEKELDNVINVIIDC